MDLPNGSSPVGRLHVKRVKGGTARAAPPRCLRLSSDLSSGIPEPRTALWGNYSKRTFSSHQVNGKSSLASVRSGTFGSKTPEFIYRPSANLFGLDVWHHPEYLSVRDRGGISPGHLSALDEASLKAFLPIWISPKRHKKGNLYLNAAAPQIDMSEDFVVEQMRVEEGTKIARRVLNLAEAAILQSAGIGE